MTDNNIDNSTTFISASKMKAQLAEAVEIKRQFSSLNKHYRDMGSDQHSAKNEPSETRENAQPTAPREKAGQQLPKEVIKTQALDQAFRSLHVDQLITLEQQLVKRLQESKITLPIEVIKKNLAANLPNPSCFETRIGTVEFLIDYLEHIEKIESDPEMTSLQIPDNLLQRRGLAHGIWQLLYGRLDQLTFQDQLQLSVFHVRCHWLMHYAKDEMKCVGASGAENVPAMFPAVCKGYEQALIALIATGEDIHQKSTAGRTFLMMASSAGHSSCVKILLDSGADANAIDQDGYTTLKLAATAGHSACLRVLLRHGVKTDPACFSPEGTVFGYELPMTETQAAAIIADLDEVDLAALGPEHPRNLEPLTTIWGRAQQFSMELISLAGRATRGGHNSALMLACRYGQEACVKLLLDAGADVNYSNGVNHPLLWACLGNHSQCVQQLLSCDQEITDPLMWKMAYFVACYMGHHDCLEQLLSANSAVARTAFSDIKSVALNTACSFGHTACVNLMLNKGANVNQQDPFGETPLSVMCFAPAAWISHEDRINLVELLLSAGARNQYGASWLSFFQQKASTLARQNGHDNIADLIEQHQVVVPNHQARHLG